MYGLLRRGAGSSQGPLPAQCQTSLTLVETRRIICCKPELNLALDLPLVYTSGSNRDHFCFQTPSLTTSCFPGKILIKQMHCSTLAQHFSVLVRVVKAQVSCFSTDNSCHPAHLAGHARGVWCPGAFRSWGAASSSCRSWSRWFAHYMDTGCI